MSNSVFSRKQFIIINMIIKTALAVALLIGLATAQTKVPAKQVPKECFAQSREAFGQDGQITFSHRDELWTNGTFNKDTRLSQITACQDQTGRLSRLQVTVKDIVTQEQKTLSSLGGPRQVDEKCTSINLNTGDLITSIQIGYDRKGVQRISLIQQVSGVLIPITTTVGSLSRETDIMLFNSVNQLVGFYGQSSPGLNIQNLGVLVYRPACGNNAAGVLPTPTPSNLTATAPTNTTNEQEAKKINMQFIQLNLPQPKKQVDTLSKEEIPVDDDSDKTPTIIIAVVVPVAVLILILVACIIFWRLKKRNLKKNSIETEKSINNTELNAETPRRFFPEGDDEEKNGETQGNNGEGQIALRDALPFKNVLKIEEKQDAILSFSGSLKQKHREGDVDGVSTPEETHPQRSSSLSNYQKAEVDFTGVNTNRDSFCPGPDIVDIQEDSQHPSVFIVAFPEPENESDHPTAFMARPAIPAYHEQESSMPALNLDSNESSAQKHVIEEVGMLPKIGHSVAQQFLMDTTPDTAGAPKRRFQEIIDSDDETNGNGSRIQRFQKKFQTGRDVFGEESNFAVNFSTEKEYQQKIALKKSTKTHLSSVESIESQKKSRQNHSSVQSLESQKKSRKNFSSVESKKKQEDVQTSRPSTKKQSAQQKKMQP